MGVAIIDTNVVSFFIKNDTRSASYLPLLKGTTASISFMTVAELYRWTIARNWGTARIAQLKLRLKDYLVLAYDDAVAWNWAEVMSISGHPIAVDDAWIAATALRYQIPLVTHNPRHFAFIPGLSIISAVPLQ